MNVPKPKPKPKRGRPRKPAALKRTIQFGVRLTVAERDNLLANADAAGLGPVGLIVARCCQPPPTEVN
ncbi:hypothetical protein [Trichococcus shcherbakoviae]|uniref:hypothetical protein n=1 Tax=Trichococcus shcherbakoviae TaxID=2094020 RepID=UPI002AA6DB7A|nr:hypothetical protein [Trichococcus shcherbakoviae]